MMLSVVASLLAFAPPAAALAQGITFYEGTDFQGRTFSLDGPFADFGNTGFNDRASSAIINSGTWQVCSDAHFQGRCVTLERGQYPDLGSMGFGNNISSARPLGYGQPEPSGSAPPNAAPPYAPPYAAPPYAAPAPGQRAPVVLFDDFQQRGAQFAAAGAVDSLDGTGFNDRARSMIVYAGRWQLCANAHYTGDCKVFEPGTYNSLGDLAAKLSSLRPVGGGFGAATGYPPAWGQRVRTILYTDPDFGGRQYVIGGDIVRNLDRTGFNDRARSLRVERGFWIFCSDSDFGGTCRTFGPGDYARLPSALDNSISSGRRISDEYPYAAPRNGGR
ncbi:MAG TPA: beta/gamma crystallin-related protein [Casimicrobiaceae bacterium]